MPLESFRYIAAPLDQVHGHPQQICSASVQSHGRYFLRKSAETDARSKVGGLFTAKLLIMLYSRFTIDNASDAASKDGSGEICHINLVNKPDIVKNGLASGLRNEM